MPELIVPAGYGEIEYVEKRSRFIGRVWRADSETEAMDKIREMREKHWDATHNVYAYSIKEGGIARFSDDGEPSGTSGMPVLNVFRSAGIENFCCVVTRYFGGILLGAGGLVRAYSKAASLALEKAGRAELRKMLTCELECSYQMFERLKNELERLGSELESAEYGASVIMRFSMTEAELAAYSARVTELTSGASKPRVTGEGTRAVRIN